MKVGIICEGRLGGEDAQLFEYFAKRIVPHAIVQTYPQGNKRQLIEEAGNVATTLFSTGCTRVLILWDIMPRFGRLGGELEDEQDIRASLDRAGINNNPCLFLIAIHKELEAWLLADGSALSAVLSRPSHPVNISDNKKSDHETNPKKKLEKLFQQYNTPLGPQPIQGGYQPKLAAIRIAEKIPNNFGQLGKLNSFKKFGRSLTKICELM